MTNALKELRKKAEDKCAYSFNSLLITGIKMETTKLGGMLTMSQSWRAQK